MKYLPTFHRRKYTVRLQEQEEHIEALVVKINNLEKQKSRLQSEVEVLIIDLEKVLKGYHKYRIRDYLEKKSKTQVLKN